MDVDITSIYIYMYVRSRVHVTAKLYQFIGKMYRNCIILILCYTKKAIVIFQAQMCLYDNMDVM